MGVVLHAVAHHIGHLVEFPVVHFKERMEYAPLHRLEAVLKIGNGPVLDHIGRVFEEVSVEDVLYVSHVLNL